jgi:hypothetical protein
MRNLGVYIAETRVELKHREAYELVHWRPGMVLVENIMHK